MSDAMEYEREGEQVEPVLLFCRGRKQACSEFAKQIYELLLFTGGQNE